MAQTQSILDAELRRFRAAGRIFAWLAQRRWGARMLHRLNSVANKGKGLDGFLNEERWVQSTTSSNYKIRVRIYKPKNVTGPLPAMLYCHGGGFIMGVPEQARPFYKDILEQRDVVIIAPAYRLALDHPFPAGFNDCYDVLAWMKAHASELGIAADNFILAGHSAGGSMTAALTLKARDTRDFSIAFQMPIYPMLDHRMTTQSAQTMTDSLVWNRATNTFGWDQYLLATDRTAVPAYASPALNTDYSDFPPTVSFVGDLEPFLDETLDYIEALNSAKVPTLFKVFPGAFHGFETIARKAQISKDANRFQALAFAEFYDRYSQK